METIGRFPKALVTALLVAATLVPRAAVGAGSEDPRDRYRRDQDIRQAVHAVLQRDPRLAGAHATAAVKDGVVSLMGSVNSAHERRAAEEAAAGVPGVRGVDNGLTVVPSSLPDDDSVEMRVRAALSRTPYFDPDRVTAEVVNGVVYLTGQVSSPFERLRVQYAVFAVPGVVDIVDRLIVAPR